MHSTLVTIRFCISEAAVESFRKAAPTPCGKLGPRYASRVARYHNL